uniref:Uncharacterized protein n=1 Tax=Lepeophtheirus salmonis TaxID=72036 RepID=A0A0K2UPV8_LEPSM
MPFKQRLTPVPVSLLAHALPVEIFEWRMVQAFVSTSINNMKSSGFTRGLERDMKSSWLLLSQNNLYVAVAVSAGAPSYKKTTVRSKKEFSAQGMRLIAR